MKYSLKVKALNFDFKYEGSNPSISIMTFINNKGYIYKLLIGFRTGLNSLFIHIFKDCYFRIGIINNYNLQIEIDNKYLYPFIFFCKKHTLCLFNILIDLICFEFLGTKYRYVLIYNFLSINYTLRLLIKIKLQELNNSLLSITSIFYTAGWLEREVYDFFGLYFYYNKDLRRILLDYGFQGYPLRKDFPLSGFIELFYNDTIKKITYEKIALSQEYRVFFYTKNHINSLYK